MKLLIFFSILASALCAHITDPSTSSGNTLDNPTVVNVLVGSNYTFNSVFSRFMDRLSWIIEEDIGKNPYKTSDSFFIGYKLCEVTQDKLTTFEHYPLQFTCENVALNLFSITPAYAGIYNAKIFINLTEHNTYYKLNVIEIPPPKCEITSRYLGVQATGDDYCLIEINCTNSKYPAKVYYNGRESNFHHYVSERGGNPNLPNFYETIITVNGTHKSFHFDYPFNELCQTTHSLEYDDGDTALNVFAILIIVLSVLVIIATLILLYCHRRKLQARAKSQPVHIRLQN